ncbi:unnamed protein product [Rhizoctonia solani]|uniref:Uncharacterized protein n=1 Tax=Rhizoctonia solani TaxID=456999 RepID=A0A8H3BZ51_9AGAM|nr:unnamed protein product [Rhizoctonia solani]
MGKLSLSVDSSSSVRPDEILTVLAAVTAFLGLLVTPLSLVSKALIAGIQGMMGITWGWHSHNQQYFDQVRLLFEYATSTVFFWKAPNPPSPTAGTDASEPSQAQFFDPSHSSGLSTRIHLHLRTIQAVTQARDTFLQSQIELQASPLNTRRARFRRIAVAQAGSSNTKAGEINATLMDAKCLRHSTQLFCSPIEAMQLETTRLSALSVKGDRTPEAL